MRGGGQALASLGLLMLAAAFVLRDAGVPAPGTFFHLLAWAGVLLFLDGANHRLSGSSPLLSEPGRFAALALVSVPWWLCYELLNARLGNWTYDGLPEELPLRWLGYALAFGSILPALAEMRQLAQSALPLDRVETEGFRVTPGTRRALGAAGTLFIVLPVLAPEIFHPLAWGAGFLLLEPLLAWRVPSESWLFELSLGRAEALLSWCASGLACGLLWEALNRWAGGRFEMPVAACLGFLPFALGSASAAGLAAWGWGRASPGTRARWVFLLAFFAGAVFTVIDQQTVRSFVKVLP